MRTVESNPQSVSARLLWLGTGSLRLTIGIGTKTCFTEDRKLCLFGSDHCERAGCLVQNGFDSNWMGLEVDIQFASAVKRIENLVGR